MACSHHKNTWLVLWMALNLIALLPFPVLPLLWPRRCTALHCHGRGPITWGLWWEWQSDRSFGRNVLVRSLHMCANACPSSQPSRGAELLGRWVIVGDAPMPYGAK